MLRFLALLLAFLLPDPQDRLAPLLDRWHSGPEEARLEALRDARRLRKELGDEALARFLEPPVPETWAQPAAVIEVVAESKVPSWYALLLPLLSHRDPGIRCRSLEELADRDLRRFSGAAVPLLGDPDRKVAWQAAYTLIEMGAREAVPRMVPFLRDPDRAVRPNVMHVLGRLGAREQGPLVAPLLDDPDPSVVLVAVQLLGRFRARSYAAPVARFLEAQEPSLRQAAVAALAAMGAGEKAKEIAERLSDPETLVRWEALRALGALRARDFAGQIVAAVEEDGGLAPALEAMGALGLRELSPHILPFLKTPDPGIRWRAVKALGDIDAKDDVDVVVERLRDPDSFVRLCALQALAAMGARDRAGSMLALLRDEEPEVCQGAAEEASVLAAPEQLRDVSALVADPDPFVRWNALHLLVGAGSRKSLPAIAALLRARGGPSREALWAIGRLGGKDQADLVLPALASDDELVRQQAAFALSRISDRADELEAAEPRAQGPFRLAVGFALVRLGRKTAAEAGRLLGEFIRHQGEPGYESFPDEVFDALAAGFEKDLSAGLSREIRTSRRIDSVEALRAALSPLGLALADGVPDLRRRLPAGTTLPARRLLEWSFGREARLVPGRGRIALRDTAQALEEWQKRLDAP